ncbi:MAG: DUF1961 domain-containing protein [Opitutus sp.]
MSHVTKTILRCLFFSLLGVALARAEETSPPGWKLELTDSGSADWANRWFLDGNLASVRNTAEGMVLQSGPIAAGDAGHAVLWTKASFAGDLTVEYDYTRLDTNRDHTSVCILYLDATGIGTPEFPADLFTWRDRRAVPSMSLYFKNLNAYHISYACTGGEDNDYIRARRYPTKGQFQQDTLIQPSYGGVHLFATGEAWHLLVQKIGSTLTLTASHGADVHVWKWDTSTFPTLHEGRVGFRQMRGRESRYANIRVSTRIPSPGRPAPSRI